MKVFILGFSLRYILPLTLLCFCNTASANNAYSNAHETAWIQHESRIIFHQIAGDDVSAFFGFTPQLRIFQNDKPYAAAHRSGSIHISTAMLNLINDTEELAFLLAHELSHYMLMHHDYRKSGGSQDLQKQEIAADQLALSLLDSAGYKKETALRFLNRLCNHKLDNTDIRLDQLHPTLSLRQAAIGRHF